MRRLGLPVVYAVALACAGYGAWAIASTQRPAELPRTAAWLAGLLVVHDGLLAPTLVVVGLVLVRVVPGSVRRHVTAGLVASALLTAAALPLALGLGGRAGDPSRLPLPYARNLALLLAFVWLVVAAVGAAGWLTRRARPWARVRRPPRTRSRTRRETSR